MYLPTTRILLLLYLASLTVGAAGCDTDGPGNCQFANQDGGFTLCSWTHGGDFELLNGSFGGYIQLVGGSDTGILTSRTACSTRGQKHCFRFAYGFDVDNILTLSVSIKYGLNESLLWILSSGGGWNDASVPITTNQDFNVIFKAERHCGHNENQGSVRIDVIRYNKLTTNSCSFQPSNASSTSVPAIPSSCNSTIIALPSTTQKTTIPHETVTETTIPHETVTETTIPHETVTETTIPHETVTETTISLETVTKTAITLETVPATTIAHETVPATTISHETVLATTISHETVTETTLSNETVTETTATSHFNTSSLNGGNEEKRTTTNPTTTATSKTVADTTVTANSSIISSLSSTGVNQETSTTTTDILFPPPDNNEIEPAESPKEVGTIISVVIGVIVFILIVIVLLILLRRKRRHSWEANSAQQNPDGRHPNESPPTQQSDSCNIIEHPEDPTTSTESAMPIYAEVNKQRKTRQENPPLNPYEICDQSSEQYFQNAESETAEEQGQDRDGITSTPRNQDQLTAGTESVYQVPRGDPTVNSEDQGEEYNALDFEGNRCVADHDHPEGKHESGAGDLYSHLNDGEDYTYSEIDRQKRPEVVGDEYSHIW